MLSAAWALRMVREGYCFLSRSMVKFLLCTYWDVQTSVHSPDSLNFLVGCTVVLYILWCNPIFWVTCQWLSTMQGGHGLSLEWVHGIHWITDPMCNDKFELVYICVLSATWFVVSVLIFSISVHWQLWQQIWKVILVCTYFSETLNTKL